MKKIALLLAPALLTLASQAQSHFITDSLDSYITQGMKDWQIPGLAVVVVKDGQVVVMKGYGVSDISTQKPVNEQTLFMIASNTKLFTGTVMAKLETEGKISLNDKISKYFPDYKLYDPITSQAVTIRDMLCHRLGTKTFQGDFTFWNSQLSREEIMKRMQLLKPVGLFRQDFGYCNSCFMTAGQIVPKATGISWEQYVQDSILTQLGMSHSTSISKGMETKENVARPYTTSYTGKLNRIPYDQWDNLAPAAAIISNVQDLSHWLMFQLDSGRYQGKQIMPFSVLQKTRDVNISTGSRRSPILPQHFRGYGLGLFAADYNGRQIYWHTGGAGGMVSNVCFVPEERLGIAILTNNDNQSFFEALRYQLLDTYLGMPYINRSQQFLRGFQIEMSQQLSEIAQWKSRVKGSKTELPLNAYTGIYTHPLYGTVTISQQGNDLAVRFNSHANLTARLQYMDHGEWLMSYDNIEYGIFSIRFRIDANKVASVELRANEFVEYDPYTFTKSN